MINSHRYKSAVATTRGKCDVITKKCEEHREFQLVPLSAKASQYNTRGRNFEIASVVRVDKILHSNMESWTYECLFNLLN